MSANTREGRRGKAGGHGQSAPSARCRAELEPAYRATDYCVETDEGPRVLHIDRPAEAVAAWMTARGIRRLVVFTACNPGSHPLGDEANAERQRRLERSVAQHGLRAWPAHNRDPRHQWPDEPGLAIADLPDDLLAHWLQAFGQNAAVRLEPPGPPRLVWAPESAGCETPPARDSSD